MSAQQSSRLDPYHEWLGIPPEEQPPDHYRLLGINQFEDNVKVIENAAHRQAAHVRTFQLGKHVNECENLLAEISQARNCLLNGERKAAYDAELTTTLFTSVAPEEPLPTTPKSPATETFPAPRPQPAADPPPVIKEFQPARPQRRPIPRRKLPRKPETSRRVLIILIFAPIVGLALGVVTFYITYRPGGAEKPGGLSLSRIRIERVENQILMPGDTLSLRIAAQNRDNPSSPLRYEFAANVPSGAAIRPQTGVFSFTPNKAQVGHTYSIAVKVSIPGRPEVSKTTNFNIRVIDARPGLIAHFYNGIDLDPNLFIKSITLDKIEFSTEEAPVGGVPVDNFSIRFTGFIKAQEPGRYNFSAFSDDGIRVRLDKQELVESWRPQVATIVAQATLTGQLQPFELDFFESWGSASLKINWERLDDDRASHVALFHDAAVSPASSDAGWIDVLRLVDVQRHAVTGTWTRSDDGISTDDSHDSRITIPSFLGGSYELSVEFTRTQGINAISVVLPVGDSSCLIMLSGWNGKAAGLWAVDRQPFPDLAENQQRALDFPIANDHRYRLDIQVTIEEEMATIESHLDGRVFLTWHGEIKSLSLPGPWHMPNENSLGIGANFCEVTFHAVAMRYSSRDVDSKNVLQPNVNAGTQTASTNLLQYVDVDRLTVVGQWVRSEDGITVVSEEPAARIAVPSFLDQDYEVRIEFTRHSGNDSINAILPVGNSHCVCFLSAWLGRVSGLESIDGKGGRDIDQNLRNHVGERLQNGRRYRWDIAVTVRGDVGTVVASLDDTPMLDWQGKTSSLAVPKHWAMPNRHSIGLGVWSSRVTFHEVTVLSSSTEVGSTKTAVNP